MYKILRRLFNDNILIPFGLLAAFVNTGSLSATLFLRTYEMQATIFLLLTYVCIKFYDNIKSSTFLSKKNFFIAAFVLALTLLTGYMAIFFVALMGVFLICVSVKEKQQNTYQCHTDMFFCKSTEKAQKPFQTVVLHIGTPSDQTAYPTCGGKAPAPRVCRGDRR